MNVLVVKECNEFRSGDIYVLGIEMSDWEDVKRRIDEISKGEIYWIEDNEYGIWDGIRESNWEEVEKVLNERGKIVIEIDEEDVWYIWKLR